MQFKKNANKVFQKFVNLSVRLSRGRLINITSRNKGVSGLLSNLSPSPFVLDGKKYASFEGFWQSIKFPEGSKERDQISILSGLNAKRSANNLNVSKVYYGGKEIPFKSNDLFLLAKRAERARFEQNPVQKEALLSTGNSKLIHFVEIRDSKSLPRKVFCRMLMELREEFRRVN